MKKLNHISKAILAIAMMLVTALPSLAFDFEVDGINYNYLDKIANTVEVTSKGNFSSDEYTGSITIPSSVTYRGTTYSVTSIGRDAFSGCRQLTSISIPKSVTSIGSSAFAGCDGLIEVNISDLSAWCKIDISNLWANPLYFAEKFNVNGVEVRDLVIPSDIAEIKQHAFRGCRCLISVTIPKSVTAIGYAAFDECDGLIEVNITDLSAWCEINISGYFANPLAYAHKLKLNGTEIKDLVIPNDVTEIKDWAFVGCTCLTSMSINNSVTTIGNGAFWGCTGLSSVIIPNSVISIDSNAFYNCTDLTSVTIGSSVTSIGQYAFVDCSIDSIMSYCELPPICGEAVFYGSYTATLIVPEGFKSDYANANEWSKFNNIKEIAGVEVVEADNNAIEVARYDIHGRLLSEPTPGINIVRCSDGTIRKEIVK